MNFIALLMAKVRSSPYFCLWSLEATGIFSAKSLSRKFDSSPMPKELLSTNWRTNSLSSINILAWILINSSLDTSDVL